MQENNVCFFSFIPLQFQSFLFSFVFFSSYSDGPLTLLRNIWLYKHTEKEAIKVQDMSSLGFWSNSLWSCDSVRVALRVAISLAWWLAKERSFVVEAGVGGGGAAVARVEMIWAVKIWACPILWAARPLWYLVLIFFIWAFRPTGVGFISMGWPYLVSCQTWELGLRWA